MYIKFSPYNFGMQYLTFLKVEAKMLNLRFSFKLPQNRLDMWKPAVWKYCMRKILYC